MINMTFLTILFSHLFTVGLDSAHDELSDPAQYVAAESGAQWFAYRLKAQDQTPSMCCWDRLDGNNTQCHLRNKSYIYGSSDESLVTENITIYTKLENGKLDRMLTVGDHCQVHHDGQQVHWLKNVSQMDSINWLQDVVRSEGEHKASEVLHAIAVHKQGYASEALYDMVLSMESQNALFWLAEARNDGFNYLQKLYNELPNGRLKRHINFALSVVGDAEAIGLLKKIAKHDQDTEQRAEALFWLSQSNIKGIELFLIKAINQDSSNHVREKALFSLSEVDSQLAKDGLLKIAEDQSWGELSNKALFWLAQVSPDQAKRVIFNTIEVSGDEQAVHKAVFALSQLSDGDNDQALFEVVKGNYSKIAKKQALFWLSQSDRDKTINQLSDML